MNKIILTIFLLAGFTTVSTAFTGHSCPPDAMCGEYTDQKISETLAQNLTLGEPEVELTQISSSCSTTGNDSVNWTDYSKMESSPLQHRLTFEGTVVTSTPCQKLDYTVSREGGVYNLNIRTQSEEGICTQCIGAVKYEVNFSTTADYFKLNVHHEGEYINSFEQNQSKDQELKKNNTAPMFNKNYLSGLLERIRSIF